MGFATLLAGPLYAALSGRSYAVMAMSRKTFVEITHLLDEERKKALVMASEDENTEAVYAISIQAFPLSVQIKPPAGRGAA